MKSFLPLFFISISLTNLGLQAFIPVLVPVRVKTDKIIYGSCADQCAKQKQKLLEEHKKINILAGIYTLPKSYLKANDDYDQCIRQELSRGWPKTSYYSNNTCWCTYRGCWGGRIYHTKSTR